jgi:hypothetical protein
MIKTAEQITEIAESKSDTYLGKKRIINQYFLAQDESHLFPINNRFNVTKRAIRHAAQCEKYNGEMGIYEYALFIENDTSNIVNGAI